MDTGGKGLSRDKDTDQAAGEVVDGDGQAGRLGKGDGDSGRRIEGVRVDRLNGESFRNLVLQGTGRNSVFEDGETPVQLLGPPFRAKARHRLDTPEILYPRLAVENESGVICFANQLIVIGLLRRDIDLVCDIAAEVVGGGLPGELNLGAVQLGAVRGREEVEGREFRDGDGKVPETLFRPTLRTKTRDRLDTPEVLCPPFAGEGEGGIIRQADQFIIFRPTFRDVNSVIDLTAVIIRCRGPDKLNLGAQRLRSVGGK